MNELGSKLAALWGGFLFFLVLFFSSVQILPFFGGVYDYQRAIEVSFIFVFFLSVRVVVWPAGFLGGAAVCFFMAGALSCLMSMKPFWAFVEWLRFGLLFAFALFVARVDARGLHFFWMAICVVAFFLCVKVFVGLFVLGTMGGGVEVLADGFSNHRHYAEFLVSLGALLSFWLFCNRKDWVALVPLFICWVVLFLGGGRASLLAFLVSFFIFVLIAGQLCKRLLIFFAGALLAWVVCIFFIDSGFMVGGVHILREGSSGRALLWSNALDYWSGSRLFGVGPMHYAFYSREVAAHPHNLFFQVLAEWGALALLSAVGFAVGVMVKVLGSRSEWGRDFFVACPVLIGLLVNSMFGGVWVVPAVELAFFFMFGLVLRSVDLGQSFQIGRWGLTAFATCFVLLVVIAWFWRDLDVPRGAVLDAPRFWQNGGLPLD